MLTINFKVDGTLQEAFKSIRVEYALIRALIVILEDEILKLHCPPTEATVELDDDLQKVRASLETDQLDAAFVLVKVKEHTFSLVTYCAEGTKPRVRMLYASGAGHLSESSGLTFTSRPHILCAAALTASLFSAESPEARAELMTASEKQRAALEAMELAPAPTAMPGVAVPLTAEGVQLLERFARHAVCAATFRVEKETIAVDQSMEAEAVAVEAVAAWLPPDAPRFAILRGTGGRAVMAYVCPSACRPREKMPYSSSKPSFVAQAAHHGVTFARRLEVDGAEEFCAEVEEAMRENADTAGNETEDAVKPQAPKPSMAKGPRMLI